MRVTVENKDMPTKLHPNTKLQSDVFWPSSRSKSPPWHVRVSLRVDACPSGQKSWATLMKECEEKKDLEIQSDVNLEWVEESDKAKR